MIPRSSKSVAATVTTVAAMLAIAIAVPSAASRPAAAAHHPQYRPHPHATPNLALRLSGSPATVNTGQQVTYTATVVNTGRRTDRNAGFRDWLPGKASVVSTTASQGACRGHWIVVCNLGSLARGASATVTLVVTANQPGWMTDFAWVSTNPPRGWEHRHSVSMNVQGTSANVGLNLTEAPGTLDKGQQLTYAATVTNSGSGAAGNVAVQDLLPAKASLVSTSSSQGACTGNPTIVCSLGSLPAGASATVTIVVTAMEHGWMTDHAWVSTNPPGNWQHQRTATIYVHDVSANLDLRLAGSPGIVDPGQQVTYTATITNRGNGPAASTAFQDLLPGGATLVSANGSQGTCAGSPVILCNLGALNAGASATVSIVVTSNHPGRMTDHGWVSANPPGNWQHERSVDTNVRDVQPQLALRLGGAPDSVTVGQQVTYSATVTNTGNGADSNSGFQDLLPGNITLVSTNPSQGTCTGNPTIVCSLGSLAPGGSATITIVVTADQPGTIADRGWVSTNPPGNWERQHIVFTAVHPAPAPATTTTTTHP